MGVMVMGWIATANAQDTCAKLKSLKLPDTTITEVQAIEAAVVQIPASPGAPESARSIAIPAHCRIAGSIKPTTDSDIRFEVLLPASNWSHRYEQVGNGGLAGSIVRPATVAALLRGNATAGTDDGHASDVWDARWAVGHPEKVIDYGYRAVHLTAVAAQALVKAYYGEAASHTYFNGCSDGGRESLMEAQRYPQDFDGYLAGAPGIDIPRNGLAGLHFLRALASLGPSAQLTPAQLQALSARVLERCDVEDGVKDGVLRDPRRCRFSVRELVCQGPSDGSCLTAAQAAVVQSIYDGPRDPRTGAQLAPGWINTLGTEHLSWPFPTQSGSFDNILDLLLYGKSEPDKVVIDIARAAQDINRSLGPTINSDNPDLRTARRLGRKILQFHGWPDDAVLAQWSVDYFEAVQKFLGSDTRDFYRLFMVPGMAHCFGGVGPTALNGLIRFPLPNDAAHDWQTALEHWVEDGVAPEQMIATEFKQDGPPQLFDVAPPPPIAPGTPIRRTRPVCPYPQVAIYKGTGSADEAANFRCGRPAS